MTTLVEATTLDRAIACYLNVPDILTLDKEKIEGYGVWLVSKIQASPRDEGSNVIAAALEELREGYRAKFAPYVSPERVERAGMPESFIPQPVTENGPEFRHELEDSEAQSYGPVVEQFWQEKAKPKRGRPKKEREALPQPDLTRYPASLYEGLI